MSVSTFMGIPGQQPYDIRCLSTDTKPTANIPNGSTCIEIDTGKVYMYDIDSDTWNEI